MKKDDTVGATYRISAEELVEDDTDNVDDNMSSNGIVAATAVEEEQPRLCRHGCGWNASTPAESGTKSRATANEIRHRHRHRSANGGPAMTVMVELE